MAEKLQDVIAKQTQGQVYPLRNEVAKQEIEEDEAAVETAAQQISATA